MRHLYKLCIGGRPSCDGYASHHTSDNLEDLYWLAVDAVERGDCLVVHWWVYSAMLNPNFVGPSGPPLVIKESHTFSYWRKGVSLEYLALERSALIKRQELRDGIEKWYRGKVTKHQLEQLAIKLDANMISRSELRAHGLLG